MLQNARRCWEVVMRVDVRIERGLLSNGQRNKASGSGVLGDLHSFVNG